MTLLDDLKRLRAGSGSAKGTIRRAALIQLSELLGDHADEIITLVEAAEDLIAERGTWPTKPRNIQEVRQKLDAALRPFLLDRSGEASK